MRLDDRSADGEPHTHAVRFRREQGLEDAIGYRRIYARARILDRNEHAARLDAFRRYRQYEATHNKVSSQVTMGIIVDFQKKTVVGFTPGDDIPVMIKDVDETAISFGGQALNVIISGTIDRVTGTVVATIINGETTTDSLELQCKPTQRMF
jgi:hypothetical protein